MYIVHSTFDVPPEKAEEVIAIYQKRSKMVDDFKGFLSFQLLQNEKKPGELTVQLEWETKDDYLNWATSNAFKKVHDMEKNYPDQELASIIPKVRKYQVVAR
ncbi:Heme-degrading monooxygenase HmoA [Mesobacillus persicus]|uniref:Heme-degrading monooxygenase HmoA n=1 Tax=Mesobacillus persicus TaxID=930146 RepID=A0A1H8DGX5_9BACI|nr:antibiotic biosynthesis monooxygenase family protein [Mesobacillus persicus]SEN06561.1 Heme-degrading monooxygenase HmoA [Mesobacillus persicus]